ncbi:MAG: acyltransferase [Prevotella sp.]|nr:acyltransferase [Prevotella sp.]
MQSGCNLIDTNSNGGGWKRFYTRRFRRIGIPFMAWSIFYGVIFVISHNSDLDIDWQEYITMFINGKYNGHMWFFVPLFALYLTIPFLNAFFKSASVSVVRLMAYFAFIFTSLLPFLFALFKIDYFNGAIFPLGSSLLLYGYMGFVLIKTNAFTNVQCYNKLAIISALIHFSGMIFLMNVLNGSERLFTTYSSPTCFFMSMGVFLWFKRKDWAKYIGAIHLSPQFVQRISSCSFGVYLLHGFILSCCRRLHIGLDNRYFGFLIIYAISLLCIIIMKKIPVIKNIVP